jgi:hypothetical protein
VNIAEVNAFTYNLELQELAAAMGLRHLEFTGSDALSPAIKTDMLQKDKVNICDSPVMLMG